ncbi:hypothetical protein ACFLU6_10185 [Acidobacteriota bacterium]
MTRQREYPELSIAWFVSPHGYGHAGRAAAVMAALHEIEPDLHFHIFTKVPAWFFECSLTGGFHYHSVMTDIGLVQKNSLEEDLPETVNRLSSFLQSEEEQAAELASTINELECRLAVCDIAPLGITAAGKAGIPSVLMENFTWDWIYEAYVNHETRMASFIPWLRDRFERADYLIQTEPVCKPRQANLTTVPAGRRARTPPEETRDRLGIPEKAKMVLVTMGGVFCRFPFLHELEGLEGIITVVPGAAEDIERRENLLLLPHQSGFYHPDLIGASDAVIGKIGYSTFAEVYHAGVPFGYIARSVFPESPVMVAYVKEHLNGMPVQDSSFLDGSWIAELPELLSLGRVERPVPNGADQAARFIYDLLSCPSGLTAKKGS